MSELGLINENGQGLVSSVPALSVEDYHVTSNCDFKHECNNKRCNPAQVERAASEVAIGLEMLGRELNVRAVGKLNVVEPKRISRILAVLPEDFKHA